MVLDSKFLLVTNDRTLSYDADRGQRLPLVNQEGQRLDDRVLLRTEITLKEPGQKSSGTR
jgi:hypothetical protein